ncbi:MAG: diguanylate cyclase [Planctomycetota bacterium]|nr:diguanylate cyclase [Planctomycetota bacterium]
MADFRSDSPTSGSLFSPEEIRRLMAAEFDRTVRFGTPMALLEIAVDRLGYLHDLYGEESKFEILNQINELLRSSTRSSDLLGVPMGDRIVAAVTHIERPYAEALAQRLISGTRGLAFDADGRQLRITASIGLAHSESGFDTFAEMVAAADAARRSAIDAGGDRFELFVASAPAEAPPAPTPAPELTTMPGGDMLLNETLRRALAGEGPTDLAQDLLKRVMDEVEERYSSASSDGRTELLERRVAKLGDMLERTETQLRGVLAGSGESGVASVYREVQGLGAEDSGVEQKRDLLKAIFDANLRMQRMTDGEGQAPPSQES